ncbi:hypothetical protein N3K66_007700 [Trichothecium roseum]|uniref:Uncharacterized protein n=1 Tax=Trichothecium roseum TaxID=47278 RepID=A0ACC0UUM9_9HYPO|nr:hypothetical protein N3K66_007700 [Trichothecium roseum]
MSNTSKQGSRSSRPRFKSDSNSHDLNRERERKAAAAPEPRSRNGNTSSYISAMFPHRKMLVPKAPKAPRAGRAGFNDRQNLSRRATAASNAQIKDVGGPGNSTKMPTAPRAHALRQNKPARVAAPVSGPAPVPASASKARPKAHTNDVRNPFLPHGGGNSSQPAQTVVDVRPSPRASSRRKRRQLDEDEIMSDAPGLSVNTNLHGFDNIFANTSFTPQYFGEDQRAAYVFGSSSARQESNDVEMTDAPDFSWYARDTTNEAPEWPLKQGHVQQNEDGDAVMAMDLDDPSPPHIGWQPAFVPPGHNGAPSPFFVQPNLLKIWTDQQTDATSPNRVSEADRATATDSVATDDLSRPATPKLSGQQLVKEPRLTFNDLVALPLHNNPAVNKWAAENLLSEHLNLPDPIDVKGEEDAYKIFKERAKALYDMQDVLANSTRAAEILGNSALARLYREKLELATRGRDKVLLTLSALSGAEKAGEGGRSIWQLAGPQNSIASPA